MGLTVDSAPQGMSGTQGVRALGAEPPGDLGAASARVLAGGVVAHNEEQRLDAALRSLLEQELLPGWQWGRVWIVASGCSDRTVEVAERWTRRDPRVRLVVEADRGGKSRALGEVFRRAVGDAIVLLNADAQARPGALAALLRRSSSLSRPFAVMGQPRPAPGPDDPIHAMVRLLWALHDELHAAALADGDGTHLSDELWLLSLPLATVLPSGIINDGSYLGAWLAQHGASRRYAREAVVDTEAPRSLREHLEQRRRILAGHRQVTQQLAIPPTTFPRYALAHPRDAARLVHRAYISGRHRVRDLTLLVASELLAHTLAAWDRLPPAPDHVRWRRVGRSEPRVALPPIEFPADPLPDRADGAPSPAIADTRLRALLEVAGEFGAGIPIEELRLLLPPDGPADTPTLRGWLADRAAVVRVDGDRAYLAGALSTDTSDRTDRAATYARAAELLLRRDLAPALPLVRCVGITGSTAYGTPRSGDDLDFFVVTRTGALWVFLAYTYLAVRLRYRPAAVAGRPMPCFNYVLDEEVAETEFGAPRGFLFAREALVAKVVRGDDYYRSLLASAPWLGVEIPRLYGARRSDTRVPSGRPAPLALRVLNAALYLPLASYLHLVGVRRNAQLRAPNATGGAFRTVTSTRRLAFVTERFDRLTARLSTASANPREEGGMAAPSRLPTSR
jgi:poly-beta-1,6-N-acetyl-D-glucosamine synthase